MPRSLYPALGVWLTALAIEPALASAQPPAGGVTFSKDVAAVLFDRCAGCHRPDGSAPFSLLTYQDARSRATQLATVTAARTMPPWQPEPGHGDFVGSRRLSDSEIQLFRTWARQGAPEGDPRDLPAPPQWASEWELGPPDLVITLPPYQLRADGPDMFRNIVVASGFSGTKYVRAWQFRPGNPRVVHHATIQMDTTGLSRRLDARDDSAGYEGVVALTARAPDGFFLDWAPGHRPATAVEGTAWPLDGASDLVVMLHLKPSGKPEQAQASLGLYFSDTPPARLPVMLRLTRQDLDIAPGDRDYETTDGYKLPVDVVVYTVQPHAHYLGRHLEGSAHLPDGRIVPLVQIRDWNFNWQDVYHYRDPVTLPAGTRLDMRYVYDNSDANPRNPNRPPRRVSYGQQTDDEMAELWFQVLTRSEADRLTLVKDLRAKVLQEEIKGRRAMVARDPGNAALRDDLLLMLTEVGRLTEAVDEAARSLALQPSSAAAHYNLGAALMAVGRMEQAKGAFEKAVAIDPDHVMALYNLALVTDVSDRAPAIRHLRHVLELRPGWAAAESSLAWHLARGDAAERAEALTLARTAVGRTGGRDLSALDVLATVQAASSQFAGAAATIKQALALLPAGADDEQARDLRRRLEGYERASLR
jgi:tetratricopeptide (TPR) repeat protein/mono/diheme cytochrome c family protein